MTVGIIGAQSSGKSTLLNETWGCDFDMMESRNGRSQTTKGIWLSHYTPDELLLLDIEGRDSGEQGEEGFVSAKFLSS